MNYEVLQLLNFPQYIKFLLCQKIDDINNFEFILESLLIG